jgi:hypothetical protein
MLRFDSGWLCTQALACSPKAASKMPDNLHALRSFFRHALITPPTSTSTQTTECTNAKANNSSSNTRLIELLDLGGVSSAALGRKTIVQKQLS